MDKLVMVVFKTEGHEDSQVDEVLSDIFNRLDDESFLYDTLSTDI